MARPYHVSAVITLYAESEYDASATIRRAHEGMPGHADTLITSIEPDPDESYNEED